MSAALGFGIAVTIRVTLLLIIVAVTAAILRKRSAALVHAVWMSGLVGALMVGVAFGVVGGEGWVVGGLTKSERSISLPSTITLPARQGLPSKTIAEILNGGERRSTSAPSVELISTALWLAGVLVLLARLSASAIAVECLRRRATPVCDARILSLLNEIRRADITNVALLESEEITAPATAGVFRPLIFLPSDACEWNATRLRATLAHEYAHVTRRDCLTQLLADIARAIYWFNPLIWYAHRRMVVERERACDDLVIGLGVRPENYASVLVDAVRTALARSGTIATGALSMARTSELETRLVSILDPARRRQYSRKANAAIAAAIAVGAILIAGSRVEAAPALALLEPDLRGDSIASPLSEKLPLSDAVRRAARNSSALNGPDSVLARTFYMHIDHVPTWYGDLVGERSAWALSIARNGELVAPLIDKLTDPDWRVRAYAAWSLAEAGDRRAVRPLIAVLRDPNWRMRAMAAEALQSIGDPAAADAMYSLLKDEAWQVRLAAVSYLGGLRDAKYKGAVEAALSDHHIAVRSAAADVLTGKR